MDLDFSSFIIGEGVVTAAFILTVRWRNTASLNALGSDDSAIALDHAGHLFALVRMDDKADFVMAHAISFWDIPSAMRVR